MISKACVVGAYQRKLEEIAAHPGIDLTVIVPPVWKDSRGMLVLERVYTRGYRLQTESVRFNGSFHLHHYPGLGRTMAALRPQIVHIDEEPYNLATYHAMRLAKRVGAQALFFTWQNLARRYPPPFSWMEQYVLQHSAYALAGSSEAAKVWQKKGYGGPMAVIPQFGVDPELFSPANHHTERPFTIGYAGRLVPEKGLDLLFRAALTLPGAWRIRLAGDGPERTALMTLAGVLNIGGKVHFEGPRSSTDMPAFYQSLDVLVLPSRTMSNWKEQFGRVLIEAMACGVPVIGSDTGAIPEVIGDAGLVFPENDPNALAMCLRAVMDEGVRAQLKRAGRERVLESYTQAQVAARTIAVYREIEKLAGEG